MTDTQAPSPPDANARSRATRIGAGAILLWSTLALLTDLAGAVPPFLMTALGFGIGGATALAVQVAMGGSPLAALRQPPRVWLLGVGGLFGYHALYFLALSTAPAVEANLVNYLWPLLIVLFSGLLPGERLGRGAVLGALLGLAGTGLLIGGAVDDTDAAGSGRSLLGYVAALACAVVWAAYSVLSRRIGETPTSAVTGFCLATAVLAYLCHLAIEPSVWPQGMAWLSIAAIGIGPLGAAFFLWDHGVKRGDIQLLGTFSYATPLLSTGLLILAGRGEMTGAVLAAAILIVGGALVAGRRTRS